MGDVNYRQIFAIDKKNKDRLLKVNPKLNDKSGIYFLLREDENGFKFAYIGQAVHVISRLSSHLSGYQQHIDLSIRSHGLYDTDKNPYGWRVEFMNMPESELDEAEKRYIRAYAEKGYQLRNVSIGGQGGARDSGSIGERKLPKGYREGVQQGRKNMAKELSHIIDKHLVVTVRAEKQGNKVSERQFEKFKELLKEGESDVD